MKLSDPARQAIELYRAGVPVNEIAAKLSASQFLVRQWLERAQRNSRKVNA
jgi:uncharacterized protein YjcR